GSSGGPVLNDQGIAIGVATASLEGGQNLNFAVPISSLGILIAATLRSQVSSEEGSSPAPTQQPKQPSEEFIAAKQFIATKVERFMNYSRDFHAFDSAAGSLEERRALLDLGSSALEATGYLIALHRLLEIYNLASCQSDQARIWPVIKAELDRY